MCERLGLAAVLTLVVAAAAAAHGDDEKTEARSLLTDLAQEMVARSGTSSQVLSLNLTNLIILLVLKGLLLGAAMWGTGAWKGRSLEGDEQVSPPSMSLLTEPELVLLVSYLMGDSDSKYDCLLKVACHEPKKAREYVAAGKMMIRGAKAMYKVIPVNPKYEALLEELQRAIQHGSDSGENVCDQRYQCGNNKR